MSLIVPDLITSVYGNSCNYRLCFSLFISFSMYLLASHPALHGDGLIQTKRKQRSENEAEKELIT